MTSMIQQIAENEYEFTNGPHTLNLYILESGYFVGVRNGMNSRFGKLRHFSTLEAIESTYKSFRGISVLFSECSLATPQLG